MVIWFLVPFSKAFLSSIQTPIDSPPAQCKCLANTQPSLLDGDEEDNLWVGLDKGFDYVWLHSPVESSKDPGLGWAQFIRQPCMKTNCILVQIRVFYYYRFDKSGKNNRPEFIDQLTGTVWFLKVLDGRLYCGLNDGTYLIDNHQLVKVAVK